MSTFNKTDSMSLSQTLKQSVGGSMIGHNISNEKYVYVTEEFK